MTVAGRCVVEVRTGEIRASRDPQVVLETSSLGSCVGVALYDAAARVAALCHILLDWQERVGGGPAGRCADSALPAALAEMAALGAEAARVVAHLAGGGNMFAGVVAPVYDVGARNVAAVRQVLGACQIPVLTADVGGRLPRRLRIEVATGRVQVRFPAGYGDR